MKNKKIGMIIAPMIWGTWVIVLSNTNLPGYLITAITSLVGSFALFLYIFFIHQMKEFGVLKNWKYLRLIMLLAIFEAAQNALFMIALKLAIETGSSFIVPIIRATIGILTPLIALFFRNSKEKFSWKYLIVGGLSTAGLWLTLSDKIQLDGNLNYMVIGLSTLSVIISALQYIVQRFIAVDLNASKSSEYASVCAQTFFSAIFLLPIIILNYPNFSNTLSLNSLIYVGIWGITHVALAFVLRLRAMKTLNAQQSVILGYIEPIISMLLSIIFLKEIVTLGMIFGSGFIITSALYISLQNTNNESS